MRSPHRFPGPFLGIFILLPLTGCGKKSAEVAGSVRYDGRPLPLAHISFLGERGRVATGQVVNGEYSVKGVPVGKDIKVIVHAQSWEAEVRAAQASAVALRTRVPPQYQSNPESMPDSLRRQLGIVSFDEEYYKRMLDLKHILVPIPQRYQSDADTPLVYAIEGGWQRIDIDIDKQ